MICKVCGCDFHYCTSCDRIQECEAGVCGMKCFEKLPIEKKIQSHREWGLLEDEDEDDLLIEAIEEIDRLRKRVLELENCDG